MVPFGHTVCPAIHLVGQGFQISTPSQGRHVAAGYPEYAWLCRHVTLCLFLREQLCPRRQIPSPSVRAAEHRQRMGAKGCLWQPPFCPRGPWGAVASSLRLNLAPFCISLNSRIISAFWCHWLRFQRGDKNSPGWHARPGLLQLLSLQWSRTILGEGTAPKCFQSLPTTAVAMLDLPSRLLPVVEC